MSSLGAGAALLFLAPIACVLALAATAFAAILVLRADRRMAASHATAQAGLTASGKVFDNAQRRLLLAQDEAAQAAAEIARAVGEATARLTGLARELEGKLRAYVGEAEERLELAAAPANEDQAICPWIGGGPDTMADLLAGALPALLPSLLGSTLHDLLPLVREELEHRLTLASVPALDAARERLEDAAARCQRLVRDTGSEIAGQGRETLRVVHAAMAENVLAATAIVERLQSIVTGATDITHAGEAITRVVAGVEAMAAEARQSAGLLREAASASASWPLAAAALTASAEALVAARLQEQHPGLADAVQDCLARVQRAVAQVAETTAQQHRAAGKLAAAAEQIAQAVRRAGSRVIPLSDATGPPVPAQGLLPQANHLREVAETLAAASRRVAQRGIPEEVACQASFLLADVETAIVILQETASVLASTSTRVKPAA